MRTKINQIYRLPKKNPLKENGMLNKERIEEKILL